MSYEWQRWRRYSHLGPKSGLSLSKSQQILQMQELEQNSRRVSVVSLNANSRNTTDLTPFDSLSIETNSRCQSSSDSHCATQLTNTSSKTCKLSKNSSEGQTPSNQNQCNANNTSNCYNSAINSSSSVLSGLTATAMLPIINFDNVVTTRPSIDMSSRMSRRSSKANQETFTCSQQSILSAMDRFVKAVNNMDSTVLVPSKLRDMDMPSPKLICIPPALANTDLHSFYLMLNDVKKELLWGPGTQQTTGSLIPLSGRSSPRDLKHIRQPSDDSLGSMGSTASSSSDQDTDSEADSLMTDRDSVDEHTSHLAAAFRHHLQGLHTILHQLADSADYLSSRYQEDIDASSL